ncbi:MAG: NBR1-Ig-like domain-containing protein [Ardenticatenaceae bacterium]|nr:NBR1-Ig-like domain-containing protein [Ardenticatenaceae bacterium]
MSDILANNPQEPIDDLDALQTTDLVGDVERDLTVQLIDQILAKSHPMVANGIFLASIPDSYDLPIIGALRTVKDGKDQKLVDRLSGFSFISQQIDLDSYRFERVHRFILQEKFIDRDKMGYVAAHQRALEFWRENPSEDPIIQAQNLLYHGLFAESLTAIFDQVETINYLVGLFRAYADERQLAAIDRLLSTAESTRPHLEQLQVLWLEPFTDLLTHLNARYDQMLGRWADSRRALEALNQKPDLLPSLRPYVARAFGDSMAYSGDFVGAIEQYKISLNLFKSIIAQQKEENLDPQEWVTTEAERGTTMIALGDAHAGLALATRGQQETLHDQGVLALVQNWLATFLAMPMVIYLWFYLGWRVWRPRFWTALKGEDWLIARLFALSGSWYKKADPLLEEYGTRPEAVAADERLAFLYLEMGDAAGAAALFERLLEESEAPLGEYRRGSVQLGLAEAYLHNNQPGRSYVLLNRALPILERYQDFALSARAEALLGDVLVAMGDPDTGVTHLAAASRRYQTLENWVSATEIAGRLARIIEEEEVVPITRQTARPYIDQLEERHYPVQFVHPFLRWLKNTLLLSFAAAMLFIPVIVLRYQVNSGLAPAISFRPPPLLEVDGPLITNLNQTVDDVVAAQDSLLTSAESLINVGGWVIGGYIVLTLVIGLILITFTPLATVQEQGSANLVKLTETGVAVGDDEARRIAWSDMRQVVLADMRFWPDTPMVGASIALGDGDRQFRIWGTTRRFDDLRRRILDHLTAHETVRIIDRDSVALANGWLWMYLLGVFLMWSLILVTRNRPQAVWRNIVGVYSTADLYPYLYLLMFIPICWWVVGRPTWQTVKTNPRSRWPWLLIVAGVLVGGWQISTRFLNLFTIPDIYPPLFTLILLGGATWFVLNAKIGEERPVYGLGIKASAVILLVGLGTIMINRMGRDMIAYHFLTVGRYFNEEAIDRRQNEQPFDDVFEIALLNYDRAADLAESPILGINNARSLQIRLGVPQAEDHLFLQALRDRAILNAQVGKFDEAIDDLNRLLPFFDEPAQVHAWLGIAHQSNVSGERRGSLFAVDEANYELALVEYDRAIELDSGHAEYYLWRGIARQALARPRSAELDYRQAVARGNQAEEADDQLTARQRAQALTGGGWIRWTESDYNSALLLFQRASEADPTYSDPVLGLGYTYYRLNLFSLAERAFTQAQNLAPDDPLPLIGLGTVNWKLGGVAADPTSPRGREVCGMEDATPEQKLEAQTRWEASLEAFAASTTLGIQDDSNIAYTYRTMGQVEYLLRDCPNYVENKNGQYEAAINQYAEALRFNPVEDRYWELSGRLKYALWLRTASAGGTDNLLFESLTDLREALRLNPANPGAARFLEFVTNSIRNEFGEGALEAYLELEPAARSEDFDPSEFGCAYRTRFVADVTVPDDTVFEPGETFEKIWRISNAGSCEWGSGAAWVFVSGDQMGAPAGVTISPAVRGEEVNVAVPFVAPDEPGVYESRWALKPEGEEPLENSYYVRIVVEEN